MQEAQKAAAAAAKAREEEERQKTEAAARIAEEQAASQRHAEQKQAQDRAELEVHSQPFLCIDLDCMHGFLYWFDDCGPCQRIFPVLLHV